MEITKDTRQGHAAEDPARRILATARRLFYAAGFPMTGVNQIIEESGTSKKSFYRYYPSKNDLALAYIESEKADYLNLFRGMSKRYPRHADFVRAWCFILKKEIEKQRYHGCPFANFAGQTTPEDDERFGPMLQRVITDWRALLVEQLIHGKPAFAAAKAERTAERMLMLYEGAIALWRMTGEESYFQRLEQELLELVKPT
jgi:AcrR family transcriptional regulator